ncbi:MAG TPA: sialidase family protein [Ktedonobacterales bacterium]|nr:sialidase family protein [Ktedonobacterales bacterium]
MALKTLLTWRRRALLAVLATPGILIALVFSLAFSALPALAATTTISTDPFTQATCAASTTTNHHTEVEPDSYSSGSTIVAAYQVGRVFDGGACAIGFATSTNNGSTWTTGLLPNITRWTSSQGVANGPYDRATDAAVAFDAKHNAWMISSLALTQTGGVKGVAVLTSISSDGGFTWSAPAIVASVTGNQSFDKNWIVCDDTASSPFYGHCYTEWDDNGNGNLLKMSTSSNGGTAWSTAATNGDGVIGGQPVVRPDGTVIVPIDNANESALGAFNSTNGGASWSGITTITTLRHHTVAGSLREGPLPSAEIDGAGTVYIAWADSRFRSRGAVNDIVLVHSTNATGTTWSAITRVPIDATNSGIDHFIPGLAVNKATSGSSAQLGLTYYFYPAGSTQLSVGFTSSTNAGSTWSTPQTLASGMPTTWAATTSQGRMVGDYISTSYGSDNLAHGVFGTASAPTTGSSTSCSTTALDNCVAPISTFVTGLAASGARSSAGDHVLTAAPAFSTRHNHLWDPHQEDPDF